MRVYRYCGATPIVIALFFSGTSAGLGRIGVTLPPEAYLDPIDQQIARSGVGLPDRPSPCASARRNGVGKLTAISKLPPERCVRMTQPQRWSALWKDEFEGSQFCPKPATNCPQDGRIWLSGLRAGSPGGLYAVEFIGRQTIDKGAYGHFGLSDHYILVDQLISMKRLSPAQ